MARLRDYSDDERAHALAVLRSNNGNMKKTAQETGTPRSTLRAWAGLREAEGKHAADVAPEKVDNAAEQLAVSWRHIANMSLALMAEFLERLRDVEKVKAGDVRDLSVVAGVATEKESFARGGPTARTESVRVSLVEPDVLRKDTLKVIEGGRK